MSPPRRAGERKSDTPRSPKGSDLSERMSSEQILASLVDQLDAFSPQIRKAARYLADHPRELAVTPLRELAEKAEVKPSTLVRVASAIGFDSFSEFRRPFRDSLQLDPDRITVRARQLGARENAADRLCAEMADAAASGLEGFFANIDATRFQDIAQDIVKARRVVVTAVGSCFPMAHYFHYIGRMALPGLALTPQAGGLPIDDLIDLGPKDVLIALSFRPYRQETIDATKLARSRGARVVAITDSRAAPIAKNATTILTVPTESPQYFPSMAVVVTILETLLAFVVAAGRARAVDNIETFDRVRHDFTIWWRET